MKRGGAAAVAAPRKGRGMSLYRYFVTRNRAWVPNTLPVRCWHAKQWQMDTRTGSPVHVRRNWLQAQAAMRFVMVSFSQLGLWHAIIGSSHGPCPLLNGSASLGVLL
jgi:hypothetical protein